MTAEYSLLLRDELRKRNRAYVSKRSLPFVETYGANPVIVYHPDKQAHGNFHPAAYSSILSNESWRRRLNKVHTLARQCLPRTDRPWRELDSCMSSDALLMNVFCCPATLESPFVRLLLDTECTAVPEFGFKAKVPLANGRTDRTEIDLKLGALLIEAKLTESDFQKKRRIVVEAYRDFARVFDRSTLPREGDAYLGYQLIRGVLAAFATASSFCVLLDSRRPDLIEQWYAVMRAVKDPDLRVRCKVLTWQELSECLSTELQRFLDEKYGIAPPGRNATPLATEESEFE